jgi:predicted ATPase
MDSNAIPIEILYGRRVEHFSAAEKRYASREGLAMNLRVAIFVVAAAAFAVGWNSTHARLWYWAGGLALGGFVAAVEYHEHVRRQWQRNGLLRQINQEAIARLRRDWMALPKTPVAVPPQHRAAADDLDLFGHASLFHFLNLAHTPIGIRVLRDWLLEPAFPDEIKRRQQAAIELAPHLDLRQTLMLEGRLLADRGAAMERFVEWAEGGPWLAKRPWLLWWCRVLPAAALLIFVLTCFGVLANERGGVALFVVVCLNGCTIAQFGGRVHDIFSRRGEAARYLRMFELMYAMPESSSELDVVKRETTSLGGGAPLRLRQLNWIAKLAMLSHELYLALLYLPLEFMFLYDFQVLNLLEAWQAHYGRYARRWFLGLGKFEALCSLGGLTADQPQWTMPEVNVSADRFQARQLGHPLLPSESCVRNDVELGPAGSFLLVTGSNMSGKSTLLRAVGVNVVLAQAGAPVCAEQLTMPPVVLATSVRVRDSLEAGVSFYMAELMRLKEIVDLARDAAPRNHRMLLYLLDEILQGTNSKERHIAVVRVLQHLLHHGTTGVVSTHDLDLATSESLAQNCRCVHFSETLHDEHAEQRMTFDYKLRPGIATTSNALKLLEIVGLGEADGRP